MKDKRLADLNFNDLLQYGGQPPVKHRYEPPLPCGGYCVTCDRPFGVQLDLMSHGCDTSDFEKLLGRIPNASENRPILFLLERPGGDWENGGPVKFDGFNKKPPIKHYYWTPSCKSWPRKIQWDLEENPYGNYFAYLMRKHGLGYVYITNLVKCRQSDGGKNPKIETECFKRYLRRELTFLNPTIAFCFGRVAYYGLRAHTRNTDFSFPIVYLRHPHAIQRRAHLYQRTPQQLADENDKRIKDALRTSPAFVSGQVVDGVTRIAANIAKLPELLR